MKLLVIKYMCINYKTIEESIKDAISQDKKAQC